MDGGLGDSGVAYTEQKKSRAMPGSGELGLLL